MRESALVEINKFADALSGEPEIVRLKTENAALQARLDACVKQNTEFKRIIRAAYLNALGQLHPLDQKVLGRLLAQHGTLAMPGAIVPVTRGKKKATAK